jgi:hypothetical protein
MTEPEAQLSLRNASVVGVTKIIESIALELQNDHSAQDLWITLAGAGALDNFARYDLSQGLFAFGQSKR